MPVSTLSKLLLPSVLFASASLIALIPGSSRAHMRGMYATKAEAEKRAAQLKCKGAFAMGSMWMPCANERALHDALQKEQ
jgi:hypothetical protein